jgi:hypothetical protein
LLLVVIHVIHLPRLLLLLLVVVHFPCFALLLLIVVHQLHLGLLLLVVICHSSRCIIVSSFHIVSKYSLHPPLCCYCLMWFFVPHFSLLMFTCWGDVLPPPILCKF